ncbi:MAG: 3-methylornithine--L-lysine ligase PylC [Desulfopila sp.]
MNDMWLAVIGGKLQGVEILYLARKAGFQTILIDKDPQPLARKLCDRFLQFRFSSDRPIPVDCPPIDLILPAVEDEEVLAAIQIWAQSSHTPLVFDPAAYKISSSKLASDELFGKLQLPAPREWPNCGLPIVIKPSQSSGSRGVKIVHDQHALQPYLDEHARGRRHVIQEYLHGPSYSIEIIGSPGNYHPLQVTEIHIDAVYDCKRVTAPTNLSPPVIHAFQEMARSIAAALALRGIMDIEVILHDNQLKLLEIDARFPSQTPIAVYWSTEINMVAMLCDLFLDRTELTAPEYRRRCVSLEHIRVQGENLEVCGEHIMSSNDELVLTEKFFGADEALTSYRPEKRNWVATMIFAGESYEEVRAKRKKSYEAIRLR